MLEAYLEGIQVKDKAGRLPIHLGCTKNSPLEVLRLLLKVYPEGARAEDEEGQLPIHRAPSLEVLNLMMEVYPEGIKKRHRGKATNSLGM